MSDGESRRAALGGTIPADLGVVLLVVGLTLVVAVVGPLRISPLRAVLGLALSLFAPGYAIMAGVLPASGDDAVGDPASPLERVAYAVGLSAVVSIAVAVLGSATVGLDTWVA